MELSADRWIRVADPTGSGRTFVGFTFADGGGLSARGALIDWPATRDTAIEAAEFPDRTIALAGLAPTALDADEIARLNLPARPEWLDALAPPAFFAAPEHPWRDDPALRDHRRADNPDQLSATLYIWPELRAERRWVALERADPAVAGYAGVLIDEPTIPGSPARGSRVSIRIAPGAPAPLWVSPAMRANFARWTVRCSDCGFDMLMTPAEVIADEQFPDAPEGCVPVAFTTPCSLCRGTAAVESRV